MELEVFKINGIDPLLKIDRNQLILILFMQTLFLTETDHKCGSTSGIGASPYTVYYLYAHDSTFIFQILTQKRTITSSKRGQSLFI